MGAPEPKRYCCLQVDSRDTRPLLYDGRLVLGTGSAGGTSNDFIFRKAKLMDGVVEPAKQLHAKHTVCNVFREEDASCYIKEA